MSEINYSADADRQRLADLESKLEALEIALQVHEQKSEEVLNPFHADLMRRLEERLNEEDDTEEDAENEEEPEIGDIDQDFVQITSSGPNFAVHWVTVDSAAETPSFSSCDEIDTFEKVKTAFQEAAEYRALEDNELRRVNHGDLLVILCRDNPNRVVTEEAEENGYTVTYDGQQSCYYIGMLTDVTSAVQDPEPILNGDNSDHYIAAKAENFYTGSSREIAVWEHCTFANGDAYLTYIESVDHKVESRFEDLVVVENYRGDAWYEELLAAQGISPDTEENSDKENVGDAVYDIYAKEKISRATLKKGRVVKIESVESEEDSEWAEQHKIGSIYVPSARVRYGCGLNGCEPDPGGDFETYEECESACAVGWLPAVGQTTTVYWAKQVYSRVGEPPVLDLTPSGTYAAVLANPWATDQTKELYKQSYEAGVRAAYEDAKSYYDTYVHFEIEGVGYTGHRQARDQGTVQLFCVAEDTYHISSSIMPYYTVSGHAVSNLTAGAGGIGNFYDFTSDETFLIRYGPSLPGGPDISGYNKVTGELVADPAAELNFSLKYS